MDFDANDTLPVNFHRFSYTELKDYFGTLQTKGQCIMALLSYEGTNWVIPYICGKRTAYLDLIERGHQGEWAEFCVM